ncbi:MAG: Cobalt/magnesium transport protein CorA [Myxococcota bacterium]|nr:Cobalt/magnesium transport protein CorA [Myxococcota bacterium]
MKNRDRKRKLRRRAETIGVLPGSLVADPSAHVPVVRVMAYGPEALLEKRIEHLDQILEWRGKYPVLWVHVDGLGDVTTIGKLGEIFNLHRLALEDVVNVHQRAKLEQYPDYLFFEAQVYHCRPAVETEQFSMFIGKDFVLTFLERPGDFLEPVRERIRHSRGKLRVCSADYLSYSLIDLIMDNYFPVLETFGEALDAIENAIIKRPHELAMEDILAVKHQFLMLRRALWPVRDAINSLYREPSMIISEGTRVYLRDCYDHVIQLIDLLETYREITADLMDMYHSSLSNRMNETMQVLTVISTIFIPLTFISSIYGMNFNTETSPWNMPELNWKYGYPAVMGLMFVIAIAMLMVFRKRGWLSRKALRRIGLTERPPDEHRNGPPGGNDQERPSS